MARPRRERPENKRKPLNPQEIRILVRLVNVLTTAERFGIAFAVFIILLVAVWLMGSAQTKDDFIRELMFGSVTNTRYLTAFFIALLIIAISGVDTRFRAYRTESNEMKRLAAGRNVLLAQS